jgi:hypothetical protein
MDFTIVWAKSSKDEVAFRFLNQIGAKIKKIEKSKTASVTTQKLSFVIICIHQ